MPTLARLLTALLRRSPPVGEPLSDAELLARFAKTRDAAAFELLVWRHGAVVLGVCRRMLRHEQSAEDAFQAVFLILARNAGAVRAQLAGYLHTTARRVCLRMAKRTAFAVLEAEPTAAVPPDAIESAELAAVLDAEIARLPEKFRLAVILCYLHGLTTEQAAEQLNIPRGTVLSRLATARKRLVERLTAKGVTVPTAFLTTAITTGELAADVCGRTAMAAVGFVTSKLAVTVPSQLATEVLSMTTHKAALAVAVAVVLMTGVGTGLGWVLADGEKPGDAPKPAAKAEPKPVKATPADARSAEAEDPNLKRREVELREIDKRLVVEEDRIAALRAAAEKLGATAVTPARARVAEEMLIDLTKKLVETQLALAGCRVELKDAEEAYKKVSGKADERQQLATQVLALTEKLGVATVREKELSAIVERRNLVGGGDAGKVEKERTAQADATRERLEIETALRARQSALDSVTVAAAEADAKRLAMERAKSNLSLTSSKLELLQNKLDQVTAQTEKTAAAQAQLVQLEVAVDQHLANIRKLNDLKFDLELRGLPSGGVAAGKPDERIDRILKLVEELQREVKKLQVERK